MVREPGQPDNDDDVELRDMVHGAVLTPLFSREFVTHLRADAKSGPWPRSVLFPMQADLLDANRDAHEAQVNGDRPGLDAAIMRRIEAAGRIDQFKDEQAEKFLFGLANAYDRRPYETAELIDRILTFGAEVPQLRMDLDELADATLGRKRGAA